MDESNDLNVSLQHFWGSSYWTTILQQSPELSRATIEVLMKKNQEIDLLRAQLMRLQANERKTFQQPATPPAAAEPERYRVGERVEADWERRGEDRQPSDPRDWRMATVSNARSEWYCDVVFDCAPYHVYDMRYSEVRRPVAAPAPRKFVWGDAVTVGKDVLGETYPEGCNAGIFVEQRENRAYIFTQKYRGGPVWFEIDQVHHIETAPSA